jgi:hypothetical protein
MPRRSKRRSTQIASNISQRKANEALRKKRARENTIRVIENNIMPRFKRLKLNKSPLNNLTNRFNGFGMYKTTESKNKTKFKPVIMKKKPVVRFRRLH